MPNRKKTEEFILNFLKELEPTGYNVEKYTQIFKDMSDKQFDIYMKNIREGKQHLIIFKPLYKAKGITVENNIKVAKKYGLSFFEKLKFTNNPNQPDYMSDIEFMVVDLPYRRQSQTLVKKISVPDNNKVIDQSTYQPTGPSKGSKISYPELQVLIGMGMEECIKELIQIRGGDRGGFNAYNAMLMRYGNANLKTLSQFNSGVESTKTLKTYLTSMHISNTL